MHVFAGLLFVGLAETLNKVIFRNSTLNYYKSFPDSLLSFALWLSAFLFNGLFLHPSVMNRILFPEKRFLRLSPTTNRLRFDLFFCLDQFSESRFQSLGPFKQIISCCFGACSIEAFLLVSAELMDSTFTVGLQ